MRKKLIAANWKMYKTPEQAKAFVSAFLPLVAEHTRDEIVLCPPFVSIPTVVEATHGSNIHVGGQDMFWEAEGAYTGAVCAQMLHAVGCTHVIIGHSERRQYFGETDDTVNRKLRAALVVGLKPIVCVGEVLQEREAGVTDDILRRQCSIRLPRDCRRRSSYDYCGLRTGVGDWHRQNRHAGAGGGSTQGNSSAGCGAFGDDVAAKMRILYGGSVKPDNAKALMSQPEIDGALVGGASLDPKGFAAIVKW